MQGAESSCPFFPKCKGPLKGLSRLSLSSCVLRSGTAAASAQAASTAWRCPPAASPHRSPAAWLGSAPSRLDRRRFWQPNSHFATFFKIYKICMLLHRSELNFFWRKLFKIFRNFAKISKLFENLQFFFQNLSKITKKWDGSLLFFSVERCRIVKIL